MPEQQLFEYAVIRVVPKVEREEFINVGVIVFSKKGKFLQSKCELNEARLKALCDTIDTEEIKTYLHAFERICKGSADGGPIAKLDMPSRFRWLTATRSTVVQSSKVHPGFCEDLEKALERLFEQLVR
jgi:hypothetical protein